MSDFTPHKKTAITFMRPYVPGEDLLAQGITINLVVDTPEAGGMIARNTNDHRDMWYIAPEYFEANYEKE